MGDNLGRTFCGVLGYDALEAMNKMDVNDCQSTRRDFVRTAFAAIEGWLWYYKQEVQSTIGTVRAFSALEEAALSETSYLITDTGKLRAQTRFTAMATMFRFVTRIAEQQYGGPLVDFQTSDWKNFNDAIAIRNRITHPKNIPDLTLSERDIMVVKNALLWLVEIVVTTMEKLKLMLEDHLASFREVSEALIAGDPDMLRLYKTALDGTET
jgi:hypothetical protein